MNIEERIKQYLEERNKELEEDRRKIAEGILSKVWDFQEGFPKEEVLGFVLRNNDSCFEIVIQFKNLTARGFATGGIDYQTPVLNHVKKILESCGVDCSEVEDGKDFCAYY